MTGVFCGVWEEVEEESAGEVVVGDVAGVEDEDDMEEEDDARDVLVVEGA